ncbi:MAG: TetR/AcrR family transcriptional regulator, partial [Jatrophihabitantaceae bacterium]
TRGALYHQFADKADLFAAVVEAVEIEVTRRIDEIVSSSTEPDVIALMKLGADAWLAQCADPAISRILLVDAPAVLGWARWREIGLRHGLGLVQGLLQHAISVGRIAQQPVEPLAHVLIGALDEAALYVVRHAEPDWARSEVRRVLGAVIDSFAVPPV